MKRPISIAILCGGKGRRMGGLDKGMLKLGSETLLGRKKRQFSGFSEVLICGSAGKIADSFPDCGPLGGIHAGLSACSEDMLFVVACDLPFADVRVVDALTGELDSEIDVVVPVLPDGRMVFVCALFRRHCLGAVEGQLQAGHYRLRELCQVLRVKAVPISRLMLCENIFWNINTPEDYRMALEYLQEKED